MQKDIEKDRLEFIQEVIDRLIYLSVEDTEKYRKEIEKLNAKFNIETEELNGLRIIKSRINGAEAHV